MTKNEKILQTNTNFNEEINKNGCYFMCLCYIACSHANKQDHFSIIFIKNLYNFLIFQKEQRSMKKNCTILNPNHVLSTIFDFLKSSKKLKYEGIHSSNFLKKKEKEYIVGRWSYYNKKRNKQYSHFVVMDGKGNKKENVVYNSLHFSYCVDLGNLVDCRRFFEF